MKSIKLITLTSVFAVIIQANFGFANHDLYEDIQLNTDDSKFYYTHFVGDTASFIK